MFAFAVVFWWWVVLIVTNESRYIFQRQAGFWIQFVNYTICSALLSNLTVVDFFLKRIICYKPIDVTRFLLTIPIIIEICSLMICLGKKRKLKDLNEKKSDSLRTDTHGTQLEHRDKDSMRRRKQ